MQGSVDLNNNASEFTVQSSDDLNNKASEFIVKSLDDMNNNASQFIVQTQSFRGLITKQPTSQLAAVEEIKT